jgi:hypothetical protein
MEDKEDSVTVKFLKNTLKKGTDFAHDFWEGTKREATETKISILIIRKMIQNKEVTDGEIKFLKEHSKDLVKIVPLVLISGIPIPVPIVPLLVVLGKKYGFDFLPKDNRHWLDDTKIKGKEKEL